MNTKNIKEILSRDLEPLFVEKGFKTKNESQLVFSYYAEKKDVTYAVDGHLLKYNDYVLVYHFYFGIKKVVEHLREIDRVVPLDSNKYTVSNSLITISPGVVLFPKETDRAYKSFDSDFKLKLILFDIQVFYQDFYLPFCNKFSDIKQLDKLFNRLDDFRTDSSIFPGLAFFYVTRLIIARMANNPDYDEVVERNFQILEAEFRKFGGTYDRNDETQPVVFAAKYLRDLKV